MEARGQWRPEASGGREASMTIGASRAQHSAPDGPAPVSLLWPRGAPQRSSDGPQLPPDAAADLQVTELITVLSAGEGRPARRHHRERLVRQTLSALCTNPAVIAYRQAVVADLLDSPSLRERLAQVLPDLEALAHTSPSGRFQVPDEAAVQRVARQLGDLELFVDVARQLERALDDEDMVRSAALAALREYVQAITSAPAFVALEAELPGLRTTFTQARSVTIGINLTPDLVPESATILALSEERVEGVQTLLGKLLGGQDASRGITPLHRGGTGGVTGFVGQPNRLTHDLTRLLEDVAAPVGKALERYAGLSVETLAAIGPELALLLNGALLVERLARAGLPMCRPEILPPDDRVTELVDGYDISLALRLHRPDGTPTGSAPPVIGETGATTSVVTNLMTFDGTLGRVWILTGPNRAGKTTYTRAVGLAHVLFQAGLYVPASAAQLSPVDAIYTH